MKKALYLIIIIIVPLVVSCTKKGIIPKSTLSDIYYDLYLADKYLANTGYGDTLLIYEPIFNKYGYTSEDYLRTTAYYLNKPDKFAKIYKVTQEKYKQRKGQLERLMAAESGKKYRWPILDSLNILGDSRLIGNNYFRSLNLFFFVPDTIPISSPTIDSAIIKNVENRFFLYDSLPLHAGKISITIPVRKNKDKVKELSEETDKKIKKEREEQREKAIEKVIEKTKERTKPKSIKDDQKYLR